MHIKVIAQLCRTGPRVLLVFLCQFCEFLVCLAVDDGTLFNPADFALLSFYLEEPAVVLEHFKLLAVGDRRHAFADRSDTVVQVDLPRGHVNRFMLFTLKALAPCRQPHHAEQNQKACGMQQT